MHRNPDYLLRIPDHVLRDKVLSFFGYKDYVLASRACKYLHEHFDNAMDDQRLALHVPLDCRSLNKAVQIVARKMPHFRVFPANNQKRDLFNVLVLGLILGLGCILVPRVYVLLKNHFLFTEELLLEASN